MELVWAAADWFNMHGVDLQTLRFMVLCIFGLAMVGFVTEYDAMLRRTRREGVRVTASEPPRSGRDTLDR